MRRRDPSRFGPLEPQDRRHRSNAPRRRSRPHRERGAVHGRARVSVALRRRDELARLPAHLPRDHGGAGPRVRARLPRRRGGDRRSRSSRARSRTSRGAPLDDFPGRRRVSVAYELEIAGVVRCSRRPGIPRSATSATSATRSSSPAGRSRSRTRCRSRAFADAIVIGEAEALAVDALRALASDAIARDALDALAKMPHVFVPTRHGDDAPARREGRDDALARVGADPHAARRALETCSSSRPSAAARARCTYCVMRRSTNGGMRLVPMERILELVPEGREAGRPRRRGGERSPEDRPRSSRTLAERGCEVGLSSPPARSPRTTSSSAR